MTCRPRGSGSTSRSRRCSRRWPSGHCPATCSSARIRAELVGKFAQAPVKTRTPVYAAAIGIAAVVAIALAITRFIPWGHAPAVDGQLADGSTYIAAPGAKVTVLGARHVRVEG